MGLEQIDLVMDVEDEFGITIDDRDDYGQSTATVGAFYDLVLRLIREHPESTLAERPDLEAYLWHRITAMVAKCGHNVKIKDITRQTRFIEDLGYG